MRVLFSGKGIQNKDLTVIEAPPIISMIYVRQSDFSLRINAKEENHDAQ